MAIKNILFPTDFSHSSGKALYYATNLAAVLKADMVLMHSYEFSDEYSAIPAEQILSMRNSIKQEAEEHMQKLIEEATVISPNTHFSYDLELGFFTEYLSKVIRKKKIDLVVMGTKGVVGIESVLFGTNAGHVIEICSCPVLVIPEESAYSPLKKLLYLSQYKPGDIPRLKYLVEIAKAFTATIYVANISKDPDSHPDNEFIKLVSEEIDYPLITFRCIEGRNILKCISEFSEKEDIDLIVMYMSERNTFKELFGRNLTKEMSYQTKIPLLAFHEHSNED